jgi:hypothetical protein
MVPAAARLRLGSWRGRTGWVAISGLLVASMGAAEPAPELSARLVCPRRPAPGRIICEAELEVKAGVLAWGDVLVIEAPAFAPPLRARVGPNALFMKSEQRQRLQLALAATRAGSGRLRVRARAVVCDGAELDACRPAVREADAMVDVGPITR